MIMPVSNAAREDINFHVPRIVPHPDRPVQPLHHCRFHFWNIHTVDFCSNAQKQTVSFPYHGMWVISNIKPRNMPDYGNIFDGYSVAQKQTNL